MTDENQGEERLSRRAFLDKFRKVVNSDQQSDERSAEREAVEALEDLGVSVLELSQENDLLQVRCKTVADDFGDEQMELLRPLTGRVAWLDLGNTRVGGEGLQVVAGMQQLKRLYLQNTSIKDEDMRVLAGLQRLEYLNVYGTEISDDGLQHLAECENLETLYLWATNVSEEGIQWLEERLPQLEISSGASFFGDDNQSYDLL